jgi:hypothetical protein
MLSTNKASAIGAELAAICFNILSAFLSIGAMAGPFKALSVPAAESSSDACRPVSLSFTIRGVVTAPQDGSGAASLALYSEGCKVSDPTICALTKGASVSGSASVSGGF